MELCKEIGVATGTIVVDEVTIVPLFAWYPIFPCSFPSSPSL
jgi:hypothetical protein